MNIQLLNKIAAVGIRELGDGYNNIGENVENPDGIDVLWCEKTDCEKI